MLEFKEPIPKEELLLEPGQIFLSAGKTVAYQVLSGPMCRLYRGNGPIEPWKGESSWYDTGCPRKGWRRSGANFPSYRVTHIETGAELEITLRWTPQRVASMAVAIAITQEAREEYLSSQENVYVDIGSAMLDRHNR